VILSSDGRSLDRLGLSGGSARRPILLVLFALVASLIAVWAAPGSAEATSVYTTLTGADRYETAILVSKQAYPSGAPAVALVKGDDFPDALSAAPLAYAFGGPVILTPSGGLTPAVKAELQRLKPGKVFFIGLPESVRPGLVDAVGNAEIVTIRGKDRYETAALLAAELKKKRGTVEKFVLAPGNTFPDALSVAPLAAKKGWPILLTPQAGPLPKVTSTQIQALGVTSALVVGTYVKPAGISVTSKIGKDRYHTSALVAEYGTSMGLSFAHLALATGENYPDALVAGPYLAKGGGVLLLVWSRGLPTTVRDVLVDNRTAVRGVDFVGLGPEVGLIVGQLGATATVMGVRASGSHPDKTRTVIDLSGPPGAVHTEVTPDGFLQVDIASVFVVGAGGRVPVGTAEVVDVGIGVAQVLPSRARIKVRLGRFSRFEVSALAPSGDSGDRVVIDVFTRTDGPPDPGAPLVVLDAGHGGSDPGATGVTGVLEKNVNLQLVLRVDVLLRQAGLRTLLTRSTDVDVSLKQRTDTANNAKANVFVAVHNNASGDPTAKGVETFYWGSSSGAYSVEGKLLAESIQTSLVAALGAKDRGARTHWSTLYVLDKSLMPAALTEVGFLTNADEEAKLKDPAYLDRAANAISLGILGYFGWANGTI